MLRHGAEATREVDWWDRTGAENRTNQPTNRRDPKQCKRAKAGMRRSHLWLVPFYFYM